ncbi:MAG: hypothetical protein QF741_02735 [Candidatus Peribacteraceae bacterium]|jgi:hypothetical protein|nr:hypothetical protein [Candidatus Peribacteraceae bacterium]MDP7454560.1 hypothetical protein [Candidatus Peribacteraceae bacterium]MDP7646426.1 hypothetical protein [Candidatus Peribacteraceae bacterium]
MLFETDRSIIRAQQLAVEPGTDVKRFEPRNFHEQKVVDQALVAQTLRGSTDRTGEEAAAVVRQDYHLPSCFKIQDALTPKVDS